MIIRVAVSAILCALLCALLDGAGFKSKGLFTTLCILIMFVSLSDTLSDLFSGIMSLAERTGIKEAASCAIRVVGLGYIFGITSDLCDSLGERAIASAVTVVGRIQIFLVAYPYFEKIISLGIELIK